MDSLTHALAGAAIGVLIARSQTAKPEFKTALAPALLAGAIAACAPDLDYLLFPLDPARFLAHWHRGPTHSLLLVPLWAWLLAGLLKRLPLWRGNQIPLLLICGSGWLSHLALDLLNSYGVLLLSPVHDWRPALHWAFELDPWLTLALATLLIATLLPWWRTASLIASVVLGLYLGQLQHWHAQALQLAAQFRDAQSLTESRLHAFPQPLAGNHRQLVVQTPTQYCHSFQKLSPALPLLWFGGNNDLNQSLQHYQAPAQANWRCFAPFTSAAAASSEILERWQDPKLQYFRDFAALPMLNAVVDTTTERCIWFSDLRYDWPVLPATFRYGFCQVSGEAEWRFYRMRYLSQDQREEL